VRAYASHPGLETVRAEDMAGAILPHGPVLHNMKRPLTKLLTLENVLAVALCLMALAVVVMTAESSPAWIYQGF
jgi:hypothetical protein